MAFEPLAQAIESWKEDSFGDIGLVKLVADLPFEFGRNDYSHPSI